MKFEPGNKLAKGGKREGAGRKSKSALEGKKTAAEIIRGIIEGQADVLATRYLERALGSDADRVLIHAIDKLLPDDFDGQREKILNVNIAQVIKTTDSGLESELRGNSLQIRIGGSHGQNGNGSNGA